MVAKASRHGGSRLLSGLFRPLARIALLAWLFFLAARGAALADPVGCVNILNGADRATAFLVERGEEVIVPDGVCADLEDGDLVEPGAGAFLLFTSFDAGCEPVKLGSLFKAAPCPSQEGGLGGLAFDLLSGQCLAASEREVSLTVTRGEGDEPLWSLPSSPPLVYVKSPELAATFEGLPFLALTPDRPKARVAALGEDMVSISLAGALAAPGSIGGPIRPPSGPPFGGGSITWPRPISLAAPLGRISNGP